VVKEYNLLHKISCRDIRAEKRNSSVGIATSYWLDLGVEMLFLVEAKYIFFCTASRPTLGSTQPLIHCVPALVFPD
jgi:hypothetical protein